ncbi:endonuclease [Massilia sp. CFBP9026]|uniref:endonuclease n=1 Tax=Massilia sp. CFBP9026 TaxID=3096536 RepID=UPI002A6B6A08|nr:endonuclease [Massilia sp. CFBP9026]MDY0961763.1 endonuclease [Massilia sp. CFBP9026]
MSKSATITVELPFPDRRLNPNNSKGKHWAATVALRKAARTDAALLTRAAGAGVRFAAGQEVELAITFIQPDRRARDRDNLLAACKPMLDGVADALGVNDSQFEPVTIRREYGKKPGAVLIEIGGRPAE